VRELKKDNNREIYLGAAMPLLSPLELDRIPDALKQHPRWVIWRRFCYPEPGGTEPPHWLIMPLNARTGEPASLDEPRDFSTFEDAAAACLKDRETGPGFVLEETDTFAVIEIADALTRDGAITDGARTPVARLGSYTERLPDGRGLRILVRANLPPGGRQRGIIEMYESHRFVALTGWRWSGTSSRIEMRQADLEALHREIFPPAPPRRTVLAEPPTGDAELLMRAFRGPNGARVERLYHGDTAGIPGDRGAADLALCTMLAGHSGNDPARLDRLFRASALFRERWDRPQYSDGSTYGSATIAKALEGYIFAPLVTTSAPSMVAVAPATPPVAARLPQPDPPAPVHDVVAPVGAEAAPNVVPTSPVVMRPVDPLLFAERQGRSEGMAKREEVLTAHEAAKMLKISPRLLRRTFQPWRRFGGSPRGDRWLLSQILAPEG
jgi:hypothetical protein